MNSLRYDIGIDVGLNGGIVILNGTDPITMKMPLIGNQIDIVTLSDILRSYKQRPVHIIFEQLGVIHGSSKATAFSMGYQVGVIQAICVAHYLPFTQVPAKVWQKEMFQGVKDIAKISKGKPIRDTKAMALIAAQRLFPKQSFIATPRSSVPHDGIVDALLLAVYAQRKC